MIFFAALHECAQRRQAISTSSEAHGWAFVGMAEKLINGRGQFPRFF